MKRFYKRSPWFEVMFLTGCVLIGGILYWAGVPTRGRCKIGETEVIRSRYQMMGSAKGYLFNHDIVLKECVK